MATAAASSAAYQFSNHAASHLSYRRYVKNAKETHGRMGKNEPYLPMFWTYEYTTVSHRSGTSQRAATSSIETGIMTGYEWTGTASRVAGVSASYEDGRVWSRDNNKGVSQSTAALFFGMQSISQFYLSLVVLGGYDALFEQRNLFGEGTDFVGISSRNNFQCSPLLGCGYDIRFDWGMIEPFALVDFVFNFQSGFEESHAGGLALKQSPNFSSLLFSQIGVRVYQNWFIDLGLIGLKEFGALRKRNILQRGTHGSNVLSGDKSSSFFYGGIEFLLDLHSRFYSTVQYTLELGNGLIAQSGQITLGKAF